VDKDPSSPDKLVLILVFEFAQAGDLKRQLRKARERRARFDERIVWKYFAQVVDAVAAMHANRIMHRDLKPANIFLTLDGTVKVGDLGLGRFLSEHTLEAHSKVGTPLYMAPEVLKGAGYGLPSDVWSLGCILYELAMLRSPFKEEGLSLYELFQKVAAGKFPPVSSVYSSTLSRVVTAALDLDPAKRPTAEELLEVAGFMQEKLEGERSAKQTAEGERSAKQTAEGASASKALGETPNGGAAAVAQSVAPVAEPSLPDRVERPRVAPQPSVGSPERLRAASPTDVTAILAGGPAAGWIDTVERLSASLQLLGSLLRTRWEKRLAAWAIETRLAWIAEALDITSHGTWTIIDLHAWTMRQPTSAGRGHPRPIDLHSLAAVALWAASLRKRPGSLPSSTDPMDQHSALRWMRECCSSCPESLSDAAQGLRLASLALEPGSTSALTCALLAELSVGATLADVGWVARGPRRTSDEESLQASLADVPPLVASTVPESDALIDDQDDGPLAGSLIADAIEMERRETRHEAKLLPKGLRDAESLVQWQRETEWAAQRLRTTDVQDRHSRRDWNRQLQRLEATTATGLRDALTKLAESLHGDLASLRTKHARLADQHSRLQESLVRARRRVEVEEQVARTAGSRVLQLTNTVSEAEDALTEAEENVGAKTSELSDGTNGVSRIRNALLLLRRETQRLHVRIGLVQAQLSAERGRMSE
jgi:NIMA (never in mitosis gene a)-related kinase 1/4/5